jgi:sugar phosphate isomerase/epimerase
MKSGRREFIKTTGILSIGLPVFQLKYFGNKLSADSFISKIGFCTSIVNSRILVAAGYSYIEEGVRNFLVPLESDDIFKEKLILLENAGIPMEACNSFLPGDLKCVGPEIYHEKILQFAETAFRRAEMAGVKTIVFGSGGARKIPEGFPREDAEKQFIALCSQMAPVAKKYNVVISLEPLNRKECNFINSVSEAGEIVKSVNHPNFLLLADIYHMLMDNEGPENLRIYGKYLYHIHIAEKEGRNAPGVHGEDFTLYFKALKLAGYKNRISIECNWDNTEIQAQKALQTLNKQLSAV